MFFKIVQNYFFIRMCFFLPSNRCRSYEDDRKLVLFPSSNGAIVFSCGIYVNPTFCVMK